MNIFKVFSFFALISIFSLAYWNTKEEANTRDLASSCNSLDDKIANQFQLFENARTAAIQSKFIISRSNWEQMLSPSSNCKFSQSDLDELKKRQRKIIEKSKKEAIANSDISISLIKKNNDEKKFCQELPKGGVLHLHPSGVLNRKTLVELGARNLNQYFLGPGQHDFSDFDRIFSPLRSLLGSGLTSNLKHAIKNYLYRAAKEGVIYVEFSKLFDPSITAENTLNDWKDEFLRDTGVLVNWKNGFIRAWGERALRNQFNSLVEAEYQFRKRYSKDGFDTITGIDLYGNESSGAMLDSAQYIYSQLYAMKNDLHYKGWKTKLYLTAHAGELGDPRNPRDAMIFGVDRIGHGVALKDRVLDLELARAYNNNKGLPIEINLHSNYVLSSVDSYDEHPFLDFLRLGLPVSFSTDDEGIFESTISTECELALEHSDIEYSELKQMSLNSIETSFTSDADKSILRQKLNDQFEKFESKWRN